MTNARIAILKHKLKGHLDGYDPDEPRDQDGKWTEGGGSGKAASTPKPGVTHGQGDPGTGGGEGGSGGARSAVSKESEVSSGARRLEGLPKSSPGPSQALRDIAAHYASEHGLTYREPQAYQKVDPERSARIAKAFEEMKHDPNDPEVKAAYGAMIKETMDQYHAILATGLKVEAITKGQANPYPNGSKDLIADVRAGHIWYFKTEHGFGSSDKFDDNPLMQATAEKNSKGEPMVANDVFRVVHDIFGHVKEGNGFGPDGEDNAWQSHVRMFSPLAAKAMTTETRGQNSWVNFGPHGVENRANPADTKYADQKAGILPDWTREEGIARDVVFPKEGEVVNNKGVMISHDTVVKAPGVYDMDREGLIHNLYGGSWSTMTAANPGAIPGMEKLTDAENNARMKSLEADLLAKGAIFHRVEGMWEGKPEPSLLIHHYAGVTKDTINELGNKFGQTATLHSTKGDSIIHFLAGSDVGHDIHTRGFTLTPDMMAPHTTVAGAGKFALADAIDRRNQGYGFSIKLKDGSTHHVRFKKEG